MEVTSNIAICCWLVELAAQLSARYAMDSIGRCPYLNMTRKTTQPPSCCVRRVGVLLTFKEQSENEGQVRRQHVGGHICGLMIRTDECLLGTPEGVVKARTIKRKLAGEAWSGDMSVNMQGTPDNPVPGRKSDRVPTDVHLRLEAGEGIDEYGVGGNYGDYGLEVIVEMPATVRVTQPRPDEEMIQWYITKHMVRDYGATPDCPGCESRGKKSGGSHSWAYRQRVEEDMARDGKGRSTPANEQLRQDKHFERAIQKELEDNSELKAEQGACDEEVKAMEGDEDAGEAMVEPGKQDLGGPDGRIQDTFTPNHPKVVSGEESRWGH